MTTRTTTLASFLAVFAVLGIALVVAQPSLTPPAGPIDESGRFGTLIELNDDTAPGNAEFRYVISSPGSYVLSGDIDAGSSSGILIAVDNVTIDLNGYTLSGTGSAGVTIPEPDAADFELRGVTIRNGRILGFERGVDGVTVAFDFVTLFTGRLESALLADLDIQAITIGIEVEGSQIDRCSVVSRFEGIRLNDGSVRDTLVRMTGTTSSFADGIIAVRANVIDCTVDTTASNTPDSSAFKGFRSLFRGCTAQASDIGFELSSASYADGCFSSSINGDIVTAGSQTVSSNF